MFSGGDHKSGRRDEEEEQSRGHAAGLDLDPLWLTFPPQPISHVDCGGGAGPVSPTAAGHQGALSLH